MSQLRLRLKGQGPNLGSAARIALPVVASAAFLFQTTTEVAFQDTATLLTSGFEENERWRVHIKAPPVESAHAPTGRYIRNMLRPKSAHADYEMRVPADGNDLSSVIHADRSTGAVKVMNASLPGIPLSAMHGSIGDDPVYPEVNRAAKGDFMMSRHRNDLIRDTEETRPGAFRRFGSMLLDDGTDLGYQTAFVRPDRAPGDQKSTMIAMLPNTYSDFVAGTTTPETAGTTMLAMLPPVRSTTETGGQLVPVVYASLLPTPNLPKQYKDAEEALAALQRRPEPGKDLGSSWKDDTHTGKGVNYSRRQLHCLATAVYFEARGESHQGQLAVAQVVINRVKSKHWPDSICGVVYQNKKWRNRCQFSFACDGKADKIRDRKSWVKARAVAQKFADGYTMRGINRATHYHATYVRPRWARKFRKIDKVGTHIFYRSRTGGWS